MWATTKYESCTARSMGAEARNTPEMPPMRNVTMNPSANFIGVVKLIWPCHIVPIQLKNFTPVGTAINIDTPEKYELLAAPVANMWCAHTPTDNDAIPN